MPRCKHVSICALSLCVTIECVLAVRLIASRPERPWLIIEPTNGLGNRIRAVAAAKALSQATGRELKIVWTPDLHCNATWSDLFEGHVGDILDGVAHLRRGVTTYDLMRNKSAVVTTRGDTNHIYIRSAFVMAADVAFSHRIHDIVAQMEPSAAVQALFVTRARDVAVHVRMQSNLVRDVPGISPDALESMGGATMLRSRTGCAWWHFVPALRYFVTRRPNAVVTVGADVPDVARALVAATGVRHYEILSHPSECYAAHARQRVCVQYAFAHLLSLAQASTLVLSEWSSFSEVVQLRAPHGARAVSGCEYDDASAEGGEPSAAASVDTEDEDLSVVVACRNRDTAVRVVQAARATFLHAEIVVVDWDSRPGYAPTGDDVVRVIEQNKWNLAQAYNVAFRRATRAHVLKIDCDTHVTCRPLLNLRPGTFATGSWRAKSSVHLNGLLVARRADLLAVHGYDERLERYGWDDTDLYERLVKNRGLRQNALNVTCFRHLDHVHVQNGERGPLDDFHAEVSTQANRLCASHKIWDDANASVYRRVSKAGGDAFDAMDGQAGVQLLQVWRPESIEHSPTCDYKLATAVVLYKLWQGCLSRNCRVRFWRFAKKPWHTAREFVMRLVPDRMDAGVQCLKAWRTDTPPANITACRYARDGDRALPA